MEKENYEFLKSEYDKQVAAFKAQLEQRYAGKKGQMDLESGANQAKTLRNFNMADRSFGTSEKDAINMKAVNEQKMQTYTRLIQEEKRQELLKFEKALEKQMWKDHGGSRLKAKEAAFGSNDPEVKVHNDKLQRQKEQQQALEAARQRHSQSQVANDFNREQARQNIRAQFQDKGGKTR